MIFQKSKKLNCRKGIDYEKIFYKEKMQVILAMQILNRKIQKIFEIFNYINCIIFKYFFIILKDI